MANNTLDCIIAAGESPRTPFHRDENELSAQIEEISGYIAEARYNEALTRLNIILRKHPSLFDALKMKAEVFYMQNRMKEALKECLQLHSLIESKQQHSFELKMEHYFILKRIAEIYLFLGNYRSAIPFLDNALKLLTVLSHSNAGWFENASQERIFILESFGECYTALENIHRAFSYYRTILKLYKRTNNTEGIAETTLSIADLYLTQKRYEKAEKFYLYALQKYEELEDVAFQGNVHYRLGKLYYEQADSQNGIPHLNSAIRLFSSLSNEEAAPYVEDARTLLSRF